MAQFKKVKNLANSTLLDSLKNIQSIIATRMISSTTHRQVENIALPDVIDFKESRDHKSTEMDFQNYKMAYKHLHTWEIARALFVLKLSSIDFFVDNSLTVMHYGRKIFGQRLFDQVAKATFYGQFVGGDNEAALMENVRRKRQAGIGPMLAIPMEDDAVMSTDIDAKCDDNLRIMLDTIDLVERLNDPYPMLQIKLTALIPGLLCKALSKLVPEPSSQPHIIEQIADALDGGKKVTVKGLSVNETEQLDKGLERLRKLLLAYRNKGIRVLVDAEYTYINPALNMFGLALMLTSYRNIPLVYYTYQNYLKSTKSTLDRDLQFINSHGVGFAAKLVRGAYLETERCLAEKQDYEDPVHPTFKDTTECYNNSLDKILNLIARDSTKYAVVVASHNEDTVQFATNRMTELGIRPSNESVFFGNLYGMCDHVSYTLGQNGYLIYKSIPYGTVMETLPYLSRRAMENRSIMNARNERDILFKAFKDRLFRVNTVGT